MNCVSDLKGVVSGWPQISVHPHRFGGTEFCFGAAEVGHVHSNGIVDIPFPRAVRDELLSEGLAEEHRWVPNSGWITFAMHGDDDTQHAIWLMRLSYLRYALKQAANPQELFAAESGKLQLNRRITRLLEPFLAGALQRQAG